MKSLYIIKQYKEDWYMYWRDYNKLLALLRNFALIYICRYYINRILGADNINII
jgi:hypothetical protein